MTYLIYSLISWLRYAVRRRFTPAGLLALTMLVATGAIGVDMDQTVAFQGVALLLCMLGVAMSAAVFFRGRFTAQRWLPRFGSVGQPLSYLVTIANRSRRRLEHLELIEDLADPRPTLAEFAAAQREQRRRRWWRITPSPSNEMRRAITYPASLPALPPAGQAEARVEMLPLKRGPLRFKGLTVAQPDPLGWFRGFVHLLLPQTVLILPKRYQVPDFA